MDNMTCKDLRQTLSEIGIPPERLAKWDEERLLNEFLVYFGGRYGSSLGENMETWKSDAAAERRNTYK